MLHCSLHSNFLLFLHPQALRQVWYVSRPAFHFKIEYYYIDHPEENEDDEYYQDGVFKKKKLEIEHSNMIKVPSMSQLQSTLNFSSPKELETWLESRAFKPWFVLLFNGYLKDVWKKTTDDRFNLLQILYDVGQDISMRRGAQDPARK